MGLHIKSLVIILTVGLCYCQRINNEKDTKNIVIVYSKGVRSYNAPKTVGTVVIPEPRYDNNVFVVYPQPPKVQTEKHALGDEHEHLKQTATLNKQNLNIQRINSKSISIETTTQLPVDTTTIENDVTTLDGLDELMEYNTELYYITTKLLGEPPITIQDNKQLFTTEPNFESTTIIPEVNSTLEKLLTLEESKPLTEPLLQSATKKIETITEEKQNHTQVLPSQFEPVIGNDELNIEVVKNNELDSMFQTSSIISRDPNRRRKIFNRRVSSSTYYTPTFSVTPKPPTTFASKISNRNQLNITENHLKNNKRATLPRKPLNSINFVNRLIDRSKKTRKSKSKQTSLATSNNATSTKELNTEQRNLQRTFIIRKYNKQNKSLITTTTPKIKLTIPNDTDLDFAEDISTEWKSMKIRNMRKRVPFRGKNKFLLNKSRLISA